MSPIPCSISDLRAAAMLPSRSAMAEWKSCAALMPNHAVKPMLITIKTPITIHSIGMTSRTRPLTKPEPALTDFLRQREREIDQSIIIYLLNLGLFAKIIQLSAATASARLRIMTREKFEERRFAAKTAKVIDQANEIMEEYSGDSLTLRQLHYQFVARDLYENTMRNYKKLGDIIRNARMAGLVSWDLVQDRTRGLTGWGWGNTSPAAAIRSAAYSYKERRWKTQPVKVEIWVEKDALSGVLVDPASEYRLNYFATKGYPSISSLKEAADRYKAFDDDGETVVILYFSDHDPEGLHMPEQVGEALESFGVTNVEIRRMGLTMEQIRQHSPPPSAAKRTSSRVQSYFDATGTDQAWELDALKPKVIQDLITSETEKIIDWDLWNEAVAKEESNKELMMKVARRWNDILDLINDDDDDDLEDDY